MGIILKQIMEQKVFSNVKLVAGGDGINNEITWVNVMEILDSPDTVRHGELLLTTGYSLQDEEKHLDIIKKLKDRGVSGLAIQPGYYIDSIPQYIIDQANLNGFPILEFPKKLTFSEILRVLIQKILNSKPSNSPADEIQHKAFSFLEQIMAEDDNELFYEDHEKITHLFLIEPVNYSSTNAALWDDCLNQLRSFLYANSCACHFQDLKKGYSVFLVSFSKKDFYQSLLYELNIKLTHMSEKFGINYYIGVEKLLSPSQLTLTLNHVVAAIDILKLIKARRGVCSYDNITFVKMFSTLHQNDHSIVLENQALQILFNYDRINQTNYVHTLRTYLANSCNVSRTATHLFIHRHTLLKRLDKIAGLCDIDLNDYYARIYMSVALLFHDYFAY